MKKISIVIPCYNVEKYLDRCIHSLTEQTIGLDALELIFIDDASTDRTGRKLEWWRNRYPDSIKVITLPENRRQGGARNEGLKYVTAETVGFVDSDDWAAPEMYEVMYNTLIREGCDFVNCRYLRAVNTNQHVSDKAGENKRFDLRTKEERKQFLVSRLQGGIYCNLFQKEFLQKAAPEFPEKTAYEDNYWMAMVRLGVNSCYLLGQELYYYFVNQQSTILSKNSGRHLERLNVEEKKLEEYKKRGIFDTYYREFEFEFLRLYYVNSLHTFFLRMSDLQGLPFQEMQKKVKTYFPDYQSNPYLDQFLPVEKELLRTVELSLDLRQWEQLAQGYQREVERLSNYKNIEGIS